MKKLTSPHIRFMTVKSQPKVLEDICFTQSGPRWRWVWLIVSYALAVITMWLQKCWQYQPLDYIKDYFGVKIGIYFAWLGFYSEFDIIVILQSSSINFHLQPTCWFLLRLSVWFASSTHSNGWKTIRSANRSATIMTPSSCARFVRLNVASRPWP